MKTLLNSWCTQGRYHDCSAGRCIFGCAGAADDITHYATCPRLWQVSAEAAQIPLYASFEERLLLLRPLPHRLDVLVTAYTVYHAVKLGHPGAVAKVQRSSEYVEMSSLTATVANAHAIKFGIQRRGHAQRAQNGARGSLDDAMAPDERPFCEAECSDLAPGVLHPCCSQAALGTDSNKDQDAEDRREDVDGGSDAAAGTPKILKFPATPEWDRSH